MKPPISSGNPDLAGDTWRETVRAHLARHSIQGLERLTHHGTVALLRSHKVAKAASILSSNNALTQADLDVVKRESLEEIERGTIPVTIKHAGLPRQRITFKAPRSR